jgi:hypothetical protein
MKAGEEEAARQQDLAEYVRAIGRCWQVQKKRRAVRSSRMVVTVPHAYGLKMREWYCDLVKASFEGAALVASVREAEAAAYYRLLDQTVSFRPTPQQLPRERPHRTLVADFGAGTNDFAVVEARTEPVMELATVANASSDWAGDRYDQAMLEQLFAIPDAEQRLADDDGGARARVRDFKERQLADSLRDHRVPELFQGYAATTHVENELVARMKPYFQRAISAPLARIVEELGPQRLTIDQVLLAGRGFRAVGCETWLRARVSKLFRPSDSAGDIAYAPVGVHDIAHAIARGAVAFGQHGDMLIRQSDRLANRSVLLLVDLAQSADRWETLRRKGELMGGPFERSFRYDDAVSGAWIVAADGMVDEAAAEAILRRLVNLQDPPDGVSRLAYWTPQAAARTLSVRVTSDDRATFLTRSGR